MYAVVLPVLAAVRAFCLRRISGIDGGLEGEFSALRGASHNCSCVTNAFVKERSRWEGYCRLTFVVVYRVDGVGVREGLD